MEERARSQRVRRAAWGLLLVAAFVLGAAPGRAADESAELDASAALVWDVLTDFDAWPGFMPGITRIEVRELAADQVAIRHETEKMGFTVAFTALTRVDRARMRLELALDPDAANDLAVMQASWQLTELPNGRVRVELRSELESGRPVPRIVERRLVARSLAETVAAFADEVARRRAAPVLASAR